MKYIVDKAIPLLKGFHENNLFKLKDIQDSNCVSSWVALFCMSHEFADKETICISASERDRFRLEGACNENWLCGYAKLEEFCPDDAYYHRAFSVQTLNGTMHMQISLFTFGKVIFFGMWAPFEIDQEIQRFFKESGFNILYPYSIIPENPLRIRYNKYSLSIIIQNISSKIIDFSK